MFTIHADNNITSHDGPAVKRDDAISFSTLREFAVATINWTVPQR